MCWTLTTCDDCFVLLGNHKVPQAQLWSIWQRAGWQLTDPSCPFNPTPTPFLASSSPICWCPLPMKPVCGQCTGRAISVEGIESRRKDCKGLAGKEKDLIKRRGGRRGCKLRHSRLKLTFWMKISIPKIIYTSWENIFPFFSFPQLSIALIRIGLSLCVEYWFIFSIPIALPKYTVAHSQKT